MNITMDFAIALFSKATPFQYVYFEAIANALDAGANEIDISIESSGNLTDKPTIKIIVSDNGDGFTATNFQRFSQFQQPKDKYHKGLGRLVFLKHFGSVSVTSRFGDSLRMFVFADDFEGKSQVGPADGEHTGTQFTFEQFRGQRVHSTANVTPADLKLKILEHFYPRLDERRRHGRPFRIRISGKKADDDAQPALIMAPALLTEADLLALQTELIQEPTEVVHKPITLHWRVDSGVGKRGSITAASVDGRTIALDLIKPQQLPAGVACIFIFESELFSERSDSARQELRLPDGVSQEALFRVLTDRIGEQLAAAVPEIAERNRRTRERLHEDFPHLTGLFSEQSVGIVDEDDALERAQSRFFQQQKSVLRADDLDDRTFNASLELSARCLMEYVLYRDFIVRKLESTKPSEAETAIHQLIVPRWETFEEQHLADSLYRNNAWLLDDKFMTFRTLLSEAEMTDVMKAITSRDDVAQDDGRPDISIIFNGEPTCGGTAEEAAQNRAVDVVIVELKRRRVDDKEGLYVTTQLLKRAQLLVDHCTNIERVWYYGILEIDDELARLLRSDGWTPLFSRGRVFYRERPVERSDGTRVPSATFLMSFDALTKDAHTRNHAFLELLRGKFAQLNSPLDA